MDWRECFSLWGGQYRPEQQQRLPSVRLGRIITINSQRINASCNATPEKKQLVLFTPDLNLHEAVPSWAEVLLIVTQQVSQASGTIIVLVIRSSYGPLTILIVVKILTLRFLGLSIATRRNQELKGLYIVRNQRRELDVIGGASVAYAIGCAGRHQVIARAINVSWWSNLTYTQ